MMQYYDPWANQQLVKDEHNIDIIDEPKDKYYDAIIIAVKHKEFLEMGFNKIRGLGNSNCIVYDLKSIFKKELTDIRL